MIPQAIRFAVAVGVAISTVPAWAESSNLFAAAMDSITADELYRHVEVLADDVYEGRAAGSRGGRAAGQYLVKQLQPYGFTPAGTGGDYTQSFGRDWRNVLALHDGYDAELEHEIIVVGAHYDHVGYGNRRNSYGPFGKIHNGADDNASGTAVLLEVMEAFATSGLRTRRAILFAFWDGEERGLVGSRHWLANPTLPAERVKLAVTIDMVGRIRGGQLYVLGTRSGYGLRRLMSGIGEFDDRGASGENSDRLLARRSSRPADPPLWLDFSWELNDNSDHWSFLERGVPVTLLHSGLHRDYHRPSDDVEKINRDGMRDVSRYLLATLVKLANADRLPAFRGRVTRESEATRRTLEHPLEPLSLASWPANEPPPRLGISWREDEAERGTVFLTRVVAGSPAAAAGLAVNDRIQEINGNSFATAAAFHEMVLQALDADPGDVSLLVERRGRTRTVTVTMPSK